ncbi:MAG: undecaprenyl diphosphate synthase [Candidatus Paceibacteria bacterium]|jgi:undecaprenyl diphosphate synthase
MEKTDVQCLGFIMDGNRRWAKDRNLSTQEGHRKGAEVAAKTIQFVRDVGIPHAIFYTFSSENWNRDEEEVSYLMDFFAEKLNELSEKNNDENVIEKKVRYRFVGDLQKFTEPFRKQIAKVESASEKYSGTTIWIALSYGGRAEIVAAVNEVIKKGKEVTEKSFGDLFWTEGMPDPDLIIRTGGQKRLSNFLPWQSVYSELVFVEPFWPEMTPEMLSQILKDYKERQRNFGK